MNKLYAKKSKTMLSMFGKESKMGGKHLMRRLGLRKEPNGIGSFVRHNPWSIGVAVLLLGAIVGLAINRPSRSHDQYPGSYSSSYSTEG